MAGKSIDILFKKRKRKTKLTAMQRLGRTKEGRGAIAAGLGKFYSYNEYWGLGRPSIQMAFNMERNKFVAGHTSYNARNASKSCRR